MQPEARALLEEPNFAHVTTLRSDGTPHAVLVWVDVDGDEIVFNSAEGRVWPGNLRNDPRANILVADRENPYKYVTIRGRLTATEQEGADEHIDALAKKYLGQDTYPFRQPGEQRIKLRIAPEDVKIHGG
jgi:PPOX class probable F420-dependent enzyme